MLTARQIASEMSGLKVDPSRPLPRLGTLSAEEQRTAAGMYEPLIDVLKLRRDWDRNRVWDRAVLVHEMTHYLQDRGSVPMGFFPCKYEPPAYAAEIRYMQGLLRRTKNAPALVLEIETAINMSKASLTQIKLQCKAERLGKER